MFSMPDFIPVVPDCLSLVPDTFHRCTDVSVRDLYL